MNAERRTIRILIVEDDAVNRKLFKTVLSSSGYETIEAENGERGVKLAKEIIPDLIIMDIQMPVMDGITTIKKLKSEQSTAKIPVIALTSYAMRGDRERFLGEGFDNYISKPIAVKELLSVVNEMIQHKI